MNINRAGSGSNREYWQDAVIRHSSDRSSSGRAPTRLSAPKGLPSRAPSSSSSASSAHHRIVEDIRSLGRTTNATKHGSALIASNAFIANRYDSPPTGDIVGVLRAASVHKANDPLDSNSSARSSSKSSSHVGALRGSSSEEIRFHASAYRAPAVEDSNSSVSSSGKSSSHETHSLDQFGNLKSAYRLSDSSLLGRATGVKPQLKIYNVNVWDDFLAKNNYDCTDFKSPRPEMLARATGLMPQAWREEDEERLISTDPYKAPDADKDRFGYEATRIRQLPEEAHYEINKHLLRTRVSQRR